jgi:hypothetical protein
MNQSTELNGLNEIARPLCGCDEMRERPLLESLFRRDLSSLAWSGLTKFSGTFTPDPRLAGVEE